MLLLGHGPGQQNRLLLGVVLAPRPSRHLTHQARPGETEGSGTIWNVPGPIGSGRDSHRNIWFSPIVSPQSVKINHLTSFDQRNCLITRGFRAAPAIMQFVFVFGDTYHFKDRTRNEVSNSGSSATSPARFPGFIRARVSVFGFNSQLTGKWSIFAGISCFRGKSGASHPVTTNGNFALDEYH